MKSVYCCLELTVKKFSLYTIASLMSLYTWLSLCVGLVALCVKVYLSLIVTFPSNSLSPALPILRRKPYDKHCSINEKRTSVQTKSSLARPDPHTTIHDLTPISSNLIFQTSKYTITPPAIPRAMSFMVSSIEA